MNLNELAIVFGLFSFAVLLWPGDVPKPMTANWLCRTILFLGDVILAIALLVRLF